MARSRRADVLGNAEQMGFVGIQPDHRRPEISQSEYRNSSPRNLSARRIRGEPVITDYWRLTDLSLQSTLPSSKCLMRLRWAASFLKCATCTIVLPYLQSKDNIDEAIKLVLAQISYHGFEIVFEHTHFFWQNAIFRSYECDRSLTKSHTFPS
jgi:hypothetical protein